MGLNLKQIIKKATDAEQKILDENQKSPYPLPVDLLNEIERGTKSVALKLSKQIWESHKAALAHTYLQWYKEPKSTTRKYQFIKTLELAASYLNKKPKAEPERAARIDLLNEYAEQIDARVPSAHILTAQVDLTDVATKAVKRKAVAAADAVLEVGIETALDVLSATQDQFVRNLLASVQFKALEQYFTDFYGSKKQNREFSFFDISKEKGEILANLIVDLRVSQTENDVRKVLQDFNKDNGYDSHLSKADILRISQSFFGYVLSLLGLNVPQSYAKTHGLEQYVSEALLQEENRKPCLNYPEFAKLKACAMGLRDPKQQAALNTLISALEHCNSILEVNNTLVHNLESPVFQSTFAHGGLKRLFTPQPIALMEAYVDALNPNQGTKLKLD